MRQGKAPQAEASLRQALTHYEKLEAGFPTYQNHKKARESAQQNLTKLAQTHYNLGIALKDKGDLDGAIACYKKALDLDPKYAKAHNHLGYALYGKHDLDGAIACYKKSLDLDPKLALAHTNLGVALSDKHDLDGAIACYKKALDLDPKFVQAWAALGMTLLVQGRYAEARDATRRALDLLPSGHPLRRTVAQQLQSCEQYLALDGKLPAVLRGETSPANASEALALAQMCQHKRRHAAAARLYADAFAAEWKLFPVLQKQHRHNAARSAALAAAGQGEDAGLLPDKAVCMFRHWALVWLRDDLTAYAKLAERNDPTVKQTILQRLAHWRRDPDLASVRDLKALDRLPDNERAAWQALWRDVDGLAKRVAKKDEPTKSHKEAETPKTLVGETRHQAGHSTHGSSFQTPVRSTCSLPPVARAVHSSVARPRPPSASGFTIDFAAYGTLSLRKVYPPQLGYANSSSQRGRDGHALTPSVQGALGERPLASVEMLKKCLLTVVPGRPFFRISR
jgi:tetratricopeptide (TPR) repeat protein